MPKPHRRRSINRRERRIWLSVIAMGAGLIALTALGWQVALRRDTDRASPSEGVTARSTEEIPEDAPRFRFVDVAQKLGIRMRMGSGHRSRTLPEDTGSGLAWADYDGDGDFDLYLVNFDGSPGAEGLPAASQLLRNDGSRFFDVTAAAEVGNPGGFGMGARFADYDGDGDQDLYVTNRGANRLFANEGDGTFSEIAQSVGLAGTSWSVGSAWGDFDGDGLLDLYVGNYVDFDDAMVDTEPVDDPNWTGVPVALNPNAFDPQPNRLYRQEPGGRFFEDGLASGVSDPGGRTLGVAAADLNADGRLDLYVANDVSPNSLFFNVSPAAGESVFEDASAATGTADPRGSMGICIGDLGQDALSGFPSLFITHWVAQENALYQPTLGASGRLEYRDRARQLRLAEVSIDRVGWGCAVADLDADGRSDLVVSNGSTLELPEDRQRLIAQEILLHWNAGDRFVDVARAAGDPFEATHVGRGLALADFDGDLDLDLAVARNQAAPLMLRNETPTGNKLGVRLVGPDSRTIGTRLELRSSDRSQRAWWRSESSFASDHAPEHVFGMGQEPEAEAVCLDPPRGSRRCLSRPPAGRALVLPSSPWML